jgi:hypothetical protein
MLKRSTEAVALLSSEQKQILSTLLTPLRTADDFGLRTTSAIAKQLHTSEKYIEDQKQLMFNAIYEHIMETEPDLRPPDWVSHIRTRVSDPREPCMSFGDEPDEKLEV